MSAGSSGSKDSDRDIDPSLNSVKVANFILLYSFSILCWYLQYQWVFSMLVAYHQYMCILSVSIAPFFVNTVGMLMAWASLLSCSVCVVSSVEGLMSSVFEHKFYCHQQLPFSPSTGPCVGRFFSWWKVRGASFSGPAGNFSCFLNGFCSLDPHQLDRYSAGINLQVPS